MNVFYNRDCKIITTDTGYQIPTVLYRTNTAFSQGRSLAGAYSAQKRSQNEFYLFFA
jgi:hypothetical protein